MNVATPHRSRRGRCKRKKTGDGFSGRLHRFIGALGFMVTVSFYHDSFAEQSARDGSEARDPKSQDPVLDVAIKALTSDKTMKNVKIGLAVMDVGSGRLLASYHEHEALNPASNAKVYTAACALAQLGANYKFLTTITGKVDEGGVNVSDLTVHGYGDPSLTYSDLSALVYELKTRGVQEVRGDLWLDHKFFDDQTTPPAFEQQPNEWASFRAPISALAVNENTVELVVRPRAVGEKAQAIFYPPGFVDVEGSVQTKESGEDTVQLDLSQNASGFHAKLSGEIAKESALVRYTRRVEDPKLLAGFALKRIFMDSGIKFTGEIKLGKGSSGPALAKHESAPLSSILYALGKQSDNFYAEMVFRTLAAELRGKPASSLDASDVVMKWLEKNSLSDAGLQIKNGSGLFDANRVSAYSMVKVLRYMNHDSSAAPEFLAQLAVGGSDGTLRSRFSRWKSSRVIRAKTGTLENVVSLSGYVLPPEGRSPIAFSLLFEGVSGKTAGARAAADEFVSMIAEKLWAK